MQIVWLVLFPAAALLGIGLEIGMEVESDVIAGSSILSGSLIIALGLGVALLPSSSKKYKRTNRSIVESGIGRKKVR